MTQMNNFQEIRLVRDKGNEVVFQGRLEAEVSSDPERVNDRWTELRLYITKGGNFVAESTGCSALPHEGNIVNCQAFDKLEEAAKFFTDKGRVTWLSLRMYEEIRKVHPDFRTEERVE